jgi:intein/homing endonuclease/superfamily II DNA or RNA helicase
MSNVLSNLYDAICIINDRISKGFTKASSHHDTKSLQNLVSKGRGNWSYKEAMVAYVLYQSYKARVPFGQGIGTIYKPQPKDFNFTNPKRVYIEKEHVSFYYPYDPELTATLRKSMNLVWHTKTGSFRVKTSYENIRSALIAVAEYDFAIDDASLDFANSMADLYNRNIEDSRADSADFEIDGLNGSPYPYQKAGIRYGIKAERVLIADSMGLGKSLEALGIVEAVKAYPAVIVAPASLKLNWEKEIRKWLPNRSTIVMNTSTKPQDLVGKDFIIVNYEVLFDARISSGNKFKKIPYQAVVFDESHYIKSKDAKRTTAAIKLAKKARYRINLTGTPIVNRPSDLIPQLQALDRLNEFGGWEQFVLRYCNAKKTPFGWDISGSSNLAELNEKLRATCYVRREKQDVLKELPPKNRIIVPIEMKPSSTYHQMLDAARRSVMRQLGLDESMDIESLSETQKQEIRDELNEIVLKSTNMVEIDTLKLAVAKSKLDNVIAWIRNFIDSGEKLIVFAYHKEIQNALLRVFRRAARLVSGDSQKEREEQKEMFMTDPNCKLLIGGMGNITNSPAGMGHTLTAASSVAFVEFGWNSAIHDQAEDRCVVEGQLILTKQGFKPIETILIDDEVYTHLGNWRKVLSTKSHSERKKAIVEIDYMGCNLPLIVTEDHEIFVFNTKTNLHEWIMASKLHPNIHLISLSKHKSGQGIDSISIDTSHRVNSHFTNANGALQKNGRLRKIPKQINLTYDLLYAFGWFVAEGWCIVANGEKSSCINVCGHRKEKPIVEKVISTIANAFDMPNTHISEKASVVEGKIYGKEIALFFEQSFGKGSRNKKFPEWIFNLSGQQLESLMRGYFDGDGYRRKNTQQASTSSNQLASQIVLIGSILGYPSTIRWNEHYNGWSYEHSIPSEIKRNSLIQEKNGYLLYPIRSIKIRKSKKERVYDLEIDQDHSFVVGLSSVHNCHRIGQTADSVNIYYLIVEGTIEEEAVRLIEEKRRMVEQSVVGKEMVAIQEITNDLAKYLFS